jgi:O-antigen/teichoic acid export membrane protein
VWAIAAATATWISDNVWYWAVDVSLGVAHVGALRAIGNLTLPMAHLVGALSRLALPYVAQVLRRDGVGAMCRVVYLMLGISVAGSAIYLVVVARYHDSIVSALYGGRFVEDSYIAVWLVAAFLVWVGSNSLQVGLRAIEAPSCVFAATGASAVVSVVGALCGAYLYGLPGVGAAVVLSSLTSLVFSWRQFHSRVAAQIRVEQLKETQFA